MKNAFFVCFCFSSFIAVLFVGFLFGLFCRASLVAPAADDEVCTCAPCLPDLYCKKCKHKSRECPKLSWYFHPKTNLVFRAVSTNKVQVK